MQSPIQQLVSREQRHCDTKIFFREQKPNRAGSSDRRGISCLDAEYAEAALIFSAFLGNGRVCFLICVNPRSSAAKNSPENERRLAPATQAAS